MTQKDKYETFEEFYKKLKVEKTNKIKFELYEYWLNGYYIREYELVPELNELNPIERLKYIDNIHLMAYQDGYKNKSKERAK